MAMLHLGVVVAADSGTVQLAASMLTVQAHYLLLYTSHTVTTSVCDITLLQVSEPAKPPQYLSKRPLQQSAASLCCYYSDPIAINHSQQ